MSRLTVDEQDQLRLMLSIWAIDFTKALTDGDADSVANQLQILYDDVVTLVGATYADTCDIVTTPSLN